MCFCWNGLFESVATNWRPAFLNHLQSQFSREPEYAVLVRRVLPVGTVDLSPDGRSRKPRSLLPPRRVNIGETRNNLEPQFNADERNAARDGGDVRLNPLTYYNESHSW